MLPDKLEVFGGAARIWWPGLSQDSDPHDHPLIQDRYGVYGSKALNDLRYAWERGAPTRPGAVANAGVVLKVRDRNEARTRADRLQAIRDIEADRDRYRDRAVTAERRLRGHNAATDKPAPDVPDRVLDTDGRLRIGITRAWVEAFTADERARRPVVPHSFTPSLLPT